MSVTTRETTKAPTAEATAKIAIAHGSGRGPAASQGSGCGPNALEKTKPPITPDTAPIILRTSQFGRGGGSGTSGPFVILSRRGTEPHHPAKAHNTSRETIILANSLVS